MRMNQFFAYGFVIFGASFWGVTGLFVQNLYGFGLTPWQVVTIRLAISSLILFVMLFILARKYLKIKLKHLPFFIGLGVMSIALFNWCYFEVMERSSLSVAVIFVYTSPVFAAIIAKVLYNEKLTRQKIMAICLTVLGCGLVIGLLPFGGVPLSIETIVFGLFAGLFCCSYSIIGKYVSRFYHPLTITMYSMICGSLFMVPTSSIWTQKEAFMNSDVWVNILGISIISTVIAYILYTMGLSYIESSKATILSSAEIVVATLVGVLIFNEGITSWQLVGFILVFSSLFLTVFSFPRKVVKRRIYQFLFHT